MNHALTFRLPFGGHATHGYVKKYGLWSEAWSQGAFQAFHFTSTIPYLPNLLQFCANGELQLWLSVQLHHLLRCGACAGGADNNTGVHTYLFTGTCPTCCSVVHVLGVQTIILRPIPICPLAPAPLAAVWCMGRGAVSTGGALLTQHHLLRGPAHQQNEHHQQRHDWKRKKRRMQVTQWRHSESSLMLLLFADFNRNGKCNIVQRSFILGWEKERGDAFSCSTYISRARFLSREPLSKRYSFPGNLLLAFLVGRAPSLSYSFPRHLLYTEV